MPYQTIAETDGLVDGLDTFVVFCEAAHAKRPQRDHMYEQVDLNATRKGWLKGRFGLKQARRSRMDDLPNHCKRFRAHFGNIFVLCDVGWAE